MALRNGFDNLTRVEAGVAQPVCTVNSMLTIPHLRLDSFACDLSQSKRTQLVLLLGSQHRL